MKKRKWISKRWGFTHKGVLDEAHVYNDKGKATNRMLWRSKTKTYRDAQEKGWQVVQVRRTLQII